MNQVVITSLRKSFGPQVVLAGLDLHVPAGSLTAILGPSGSGKTTLLRILAGFEEADAGTVMIGDTVVDSATAHVAPEKRRIGYVPQEGSLFPHLTVAANVGFGLPAKERRGSRVQALLEIVGLTEFARRYPHQLSGGQQQRVALARALAIQPTVVLLDEPFASLDAHLRASVRIDVQQILRETQTTAVLVTHDQDEALAIADQVAVLRNGRIAQYAPPADLYSRPADSDLARFIGDANLLDGICHAGVVDTVLGPLPVAPDEADPPTADGPRPVTVLLRPEHIELLPAGAELAEGAGNAGRVIESEYYGHDAVLRVRLEPASGKPGNSGLGSPGGPGNSGLGSPGDPGSSPGSGGVSSGNPGSGNPGGEGQLIVVRTAGDHKFPAGSQVIMRARGPVRTFPR
ncbi:MAG TPA: ABC transporter ATP-binding protein [Streptosporangiaceae bacterium]|nr:ABC transporter ATP-binding protein [Streptosporangiaceae bacterium]